MTASGSMYPDPGLDLHEWESMWASVEEDADADPDAALSQLADLVERMLRERGIVLSDPVEASGDDPELVVTYRSARETAERAELGQAARKDVRAAIDDLRAIFETLAHSRP